MPGPRFRKTKDRTTQGTHKQKCYAWQNGQGWSFQEHSCNMSVPSCLTAARRKSVASRYIKRRNSTTVVSYSTCDGYSISVLIFEHRVLTHLKRERKMIPLEMQSNTADSFRLSVTHTHTRTHTHTHTHTQTTQRRLSPACQLCCCEVSSWSECLCTSHGSPGSPWRSVPQTPRWDCSRPIPRCPGGQELRREIVPSRRAPSLSLGWWPPAGDGWVWSWTPPHPLGVSHHSRSPSACPWHRRWTRHAPLRPLRWHMQTRFLWNLPKRQYKGLFRQASLKRCL